MMANIKTISPEQADGELKKINENLLETRGKIAEVHDHLMKCKDCREEYEALLFAISELLLKQGPENENQPCVLPYKSM